MPPARSDGLPAIGKVFPLDEEDLRIHARLGPSVASSGYQLKKITDAHHRIAALIVSGRSIIDISRATGYTPASIGIIKRSDLFQEVLEDYRKERRDCVGIEFERMNTMAGDYMDALHNLVQDHHADKIELSPDFIRKATSDCMGFIGVGGKSPIAGDLHQHLHISREELGHLRSRAEEREGSCEANIPELASSARVVDQGRSERLVQDAETTPADRSPALVRVGGEESAQQGEVKRDPGNGNPVREEGGQGSPQILQYEGG